MGKYLNWSSYLLFIYFLIRAYFGHFVLFQLIVKQFFSSSNLNINLNPFVLNVQLVSSVTIFEQRVQKETRQGKGLNILFVLITLIKKLLSLNSYFS